jgi:hypothetical protein
MLQFPLLYQEWRKPLIVLLCSGGGGNISYAALSGSIAIKASLESGSECSCNSSFKSSSTTSLKPTLGPIIQYLFVFAAPSFVKHHQ